MDSGKVIVLLVCMFMILVAIGSMTNKYWKYQLELELAKLQKIECMDREKETYDGTTSTRSTLL